MLELVVVANQKLRIYSRESVCCKTWYRAVCSSKVNLWYRLLFMCVWVFVVAT